jgi:hypothetical protein
VFSVAPHSIGADLGLVVSEATSTYTLCSKYIPRESYALLEARLQLCQAGVVSIRRREYMQHDIGTDQNNEI